MTIRDNYNHSGSVHELFGLYFVAPPYNSRFVTLIESKKLDHILGLATRHVQVNDINDILAPRPSSRDDHLTYVYRFNPPKNFRIMHFGDTLVSTREAVIQRSAALVPFFVTWVTDRIREGHIPFDLDIKLAQTHPDFTKKMAYFTMEVPVSKIRVSEWLKDNIPTPAWQSLFRHFVHAVFDQDRFGDTHIHHLEDVLAGHVRQSDAAGFRLCGYTRLFKDYAVQHGRSFGLGHDIIEARKGQTPPENVPHEDTPHNHGKPDPFAFLKNDKEAHHPPAKTPEEKRALFRLIKK